MIESHEIEGVIRDLGWSDHGIVSAIAVKEALLRHEGVYERWVGQGYQANMAYLSQMKQDRYHPENKLPDIKSVLVLTAWYGVEQKNCSKNQGKVARYAVGRDYHKTLKKKLLQLSAWLKQRDKHAETYLSVDSGPTVDRVLAEAAGLGFFGKNANIINPRRGSYFFIASLMTNLELPLTKKRQMPSCGSCRRCITACPTEAIVGPGVIDARRCISYLTIENKGGIPLELRARLGNRLFGCDICQEVCPFNELRAGKQEVTIADLKPESGAGPVQNLSELLRISTDEEFSDRFAGTPLMRAKRRGMLRNACVVAGNVGDEGLFGPLREVAEREKDPMLKEHALWAIGQIRKKSVRGMVLGALKHQVKRSQYDGLVQEVDPK